MSGFVKLNLNSCTSRQLSSIPGINKALSDSIISYRNRQRGGLTHLEELLKLPLVTRTKFQILKRITEVKGERPQTVGSVLPYARLSLTNSMMSVVQDMSKKRSYNNLKETWAVRVTSRKSDVNTRSTPLRPKSVAVEKSTMVRQDGEKAVINGRQGSKSAEPRSGTASNRNRPKNPGIMSNGRLLTKRAHTPQSTPNKSKEVSSPLPEHVAEVQCSNREELYPFMGDIQLPNSILFHFSPWPWDKTRLPPVNNESAATQTSDTRLYTEPITTAKLQNSPDDSHGPDKVIVQEKDQEKQSFQSEYLTAMLPRETTPSKHDFETKGTTVSRAFVKSAPLEAASSLHTDIHSNLATRGSAPEKLSPDTLHALDKQYGKNLNKKAEIEEWLNILHQSGYYYRGRFDEFGGFRTQEKQRKTPTKQKILPHKPQESIPHHYHHKSPMSKPTSHSKPYQTAHIQKQNDTEKGPFIPSTKTTRLREKFKKNDDKRPISTDSSSAGITARVEKKSHPNKQPDKYTKLSRKYKYIKVDEDGEDERNSEMKFSRSPNTRRLPNRDRTLPDKKLESRHKLGNNYEWDEYDKKCRIM